MDAPPSPASTTTSSAASQQPTALRPLRTDTKLSPRSQTQHMRVLAALHRIASVGISDVVKRDGHRYFVIDVQFTKPLEGLAKPAEGAGTARLSGPGDLQVHRRFSEFANLRHELYYHAHSGHRSHSKPCAFCASVIEILTHAPALPRLHKGLFQTTDALRQDLDAFVTLALSLATQAKHGATGQWCEGRAMVPLLVKQFLLGDGGEHDASVPSSRAAPPSAGWAFTTAWGA